MTLPSTYQTCDYCRTPLHLSEYLMPCSMSMSFVFNIKNIEKNILLLQKAWINVMLQVKDEEHNSEVPG